MIVLGLTGGTGAGKTTALEAASSLGGAVIDCDAVYRELTESSPELLEALNDRFPGCLREGRLDRRALAARVFGDPRELADLNRLTHPAVVREVRRRLEEAEKRGVWLAVIDAIALFESGLAELCDATVFVTAPLEVRVRRIMDRDGLDEQRARERALAQRPDTYFSERADYTIVNHFLAKEEFLEDCREFLRRFSHHV